jgi:hypothetical protein
MPKNTSVIFKLQGTIDDLTFVNSQRYKPHVRRKRGSVKKATLNSTLNQHKDLIKIANRQAKLIFQSLKNEHHDGSFWTRLVPLFFKEVKAGNPFPLRNLLKLECSKVHKLDMLLGINYSIAVTVAEQQLQVAVELKEQPTFKHDSCLRGYELAVIALYPDLKEETCGKEVATAPIVPLKSELQPHHFELPMPSSEAPFVLLLRIAASIDRGKTTNQPNLNGLAVVYVRDVE